MGGQAILQPGKVDQPRERQRHWLHDVDLPGLAVGFQPFKNRLGVVLREPFPQRTVHDRTRRGSGSPERAVHKRLRWNLAEPMVEDAEVPGETVQHWELFWGVPSHDVGVLVVSGLATDLSSERRDVVGHEPIHRRGCTRSRSIPRRRGCFSDLEPVLVVDDVEQLGVGVEVLLARVRIRRVHIGGDRIRNIPSVSAVLGPVGDRVAQVLADYPLKVLAVLRAVEVSEDIVERAVLEEHQHDVVEGVGRVKRRHQLRSLASQISGGMSTAQYSQKSDRGRFSRAPNRAPKLFDGGVRPMSSDDVFQPDYGFELDALRVGSAQRDLAVRHAHWHLDDEAPVEIINFIDDYSRRPKPLAPQRGSGSFPRLFRAHQLNPQLGAWPKRFLGSLKHVVGNGEYPRER